VLIRNQQPAFDFEHVGLLFCRMRRELPPPLSSLPRCGSCVGLRWAPPIPDPVASLFLRETQPYAGDAVAVARLDRPRVPPRRRNAPGEGERPEAKRRARKAPRRTSDWMSHSGAGESSLSRRSRMPRQGRDRGFGGGAPVGSLGEGASPSWAVLSLSPFPWYLIFLILLSGGTPPNFQQIEKKVERKWNASGTKVERLKNHTPS
jgi:hypothetical protein